MEAANCSVTPLWNVLLPVLVGGVIGIIAGVVGPYIIQRSKDAADRKRKRAEKCEELIGAVVEHLHWFAFMRYFFISGQGSEPTLSPIIKIEAIAALYFPQFNDLVRQLDSASKKYEVWILDVGQKRVRGEPGYEKLIGHDEVLTKYAERRDELLTELRKFALQEFQ